MLDSRQLRPVGLSFNRFLRSACLFAFGFKGQVASVEMTGKWIPAFYGTGSTGMTITSGPCAGNKEAATAPYYNRRLQHSSAGVVGAGRGAGSEIKGLSFF
jgi:hypothetical protein